MKLKKLFLITVLAGAMSVLGCGDDETGGTGNTGGDGATGGSGATGGTGGSAATGGGGGTGGAIDPNLLCDRELCLAEPTYKQMCVDAVTLCLEMAPGPNRDECIVAAQAICNPQQ